MPPPLISVVIPAYKSAKTIRRAVDSVLAQTLQAAEILVVDDGSPDNQAEVVAEYGSRISLIRKTNGGAASARNLGIRRATGDFLAFLDADDHWEPTKLQRQAEIFARHPEVALVASRLYGETPGQPRVLTGTAGSPWYDRVLRVQGEQAFRIATMISTITVAVRRSAISDLRFDVTLSTAEDRDLWIRLTSCHPTYLLSEPLATAVLEEGSLSRTNIDRDCGNMMRVVHRYADMLGRSATRAWEADVYRRWAAGYLSHGRPAAAIRPAVSRLRRQPLSLQAWWIVCKSTTLAALRRGNEG